MPRIDRSASEGGTAPGTWDMAGLALSNPKGSECKLFVWKHSVGLKDRSIIEQRT